MNWKIIIPVLVIFVTGTVAYWYSNRENGISTSSSSSTEALFVSRQEARTTIKIDRAILGQSGYIVVRGSDGKRLGQIIEISKYLEAGEHKNIVVELGDFYTFNEADQLIAMVYHDDGDKAFSDLDQPTEPPVAVFVETGEPVPLSVLEQQVAAMNGMGMETVRYTNTGFQPANLTVPVGTMVDFINQSDKEMWVASNVHPGHEILPTFDQFKGLAKGQNYMYTFDQKGTWAYHDHINPALEGVITVE